MNIEQLQNGWLSGMEMVAAYQNQSGVNNADGIGKELLGSDTLRGTDKLNMVPSAEAFTRAMMDINDKNTDGILTIDELGNNQMIFSKLDSNGDDEVSEAELNSMVSSSLYVVQDVMQLLVKDSDLQGTSQLAELMGGNNQMPASITKQLNALQKAS
ncbi:MAG: hypothetical protein JXR78_03280 [Victivallales bacterium]|nr:hypothetical protein [Victivallales bacterium]